MRSALMHLPYDKKYKVVENSFRWLEPGGRLILNDIHTIKEIPDAALQDHMKKRHWYLLSFEKILQYLERAGYRCVTIKDKSKEFAESLTDELIQFEAKQEELLKDMPKGSFEVTLSHWKWKQEWAAKQAFGKFYILAEK
ncbi:uncharacterized protein [Oscarella lobularis]|uniref:uncharacterized protein n=1 Tax=Oscarella lobularis TaxID=121494 RepID=UPI003313ADE0